MSSQIQAGVQKRGERGSALLIVFVFAAIVAISLYMEMPVAAFEAQRQKEDLLMTRGNEYAHAVKLFVRKTGHYPSSLKDLEDTNRMRFLRHDYADPFTGKKDWRLLHAGPGGAIIDSKVKSGILLPGIGGVNGGATPTSTAAFPNSKSGGSQAGFGAGSFANSSSNSNGGFGASSNSDSSPPEVTVQAPRQRGPAVSANGGAPPSAGSLDTASDPMAAPPGTGDGQTSANAANEASVNATNNGSAANVAINSGAGNPINNPNNPNNPLTNPGANPGVPGLAQTGTQGNEPGLNANAPTATGASDAKTSMLGAGQQGSGFGQQSGSTFGGSQMGVVNSGGVAGVASKAGGHSIKTVNDQSNYSLWEFYYDPRKDVTPGGAQMGAYAQNGNANGQGAAAGQSANGFGQGSAFSQGFASGQSANGSQTSGFGQSSNAGQSSFGQSSNGSQSSGFGQSSFGQNSNNGQSSGFGQSSFGQNNASGNTSPNANQSQTNNSQQNSSPQ